MFFGSLAYAPSGSFGVYETSWPQLCIALTVFVAFAVAPSLPSCMVGPFLPGTRWDVDRIGFDRWRSYAITQPAFAAVDRDRRQDRESVDDVLIGLRRALAD